MDSNRDSRMPAASRALKRKSPGSSTPSSGQANTPSSVTNTSDLMISNSVPVAHNLTFNMGQFCTSNDDRATSSAKRTKTTSKYPIVAHGTVKNILGIYMDNSAPYDPNSLASPSTMNGGGALKPLYPLEVVDDEISTEAVMNDIASAMEDSDHEDYDDSSDEFEEPSDEALGITPLGALDSFDLAPTLKGHTLWTEQPSIAEVPEQPSMTEVPDPNRAVSILHRLPREMLDMVMVHLVPNTYIMENTEPDHDENCCLTQLANLAQSPSWNQNARGVPNPRALLCNCNQDMIQHRLKLTREDGPACFAMLTVDKHLSGVFINSTFKLSSLAVPMKIDIERSELFNADCRGPYGLSYAHRFPIEFINKPITNQITDSEARTIPNGLDIVQKIDLKIVMGKRFLGSEPRGGDINWGNFCCHVKNELGIFRARGEAKDMHLPNLKMLNIELIIDGRLKEMAKVDDDRLNHRNFHRTGFWNPSFAFEREYEGRVQQAKDRIMNLVDQDVFQVNIAHSDDGAAIVPFDDRIGNATAVSNIMTGLATASMVTHAAPPRVVPQILVNTISHEAKNNVRIDPRRNARRAFALSLGSQPQLPQNMMFPVAHTGLTVATAVGRPARVPGSTSSRASSSASTPAVTPQTLVTAPFAAAAASAPQAAAPAT